MNQFKKYQYLNVDSERFDQTLIVTPTNKFQSYLTSPFLSEVFELLEEVAKDLQITSIIFQTNWEQKNLAAGLNFSQVTEKQEFFEIYNLLLKINHLSLLMPQTVIRDYGQGASDLGIDFLCGADLKIMQERSHFSFDHLSKGLTPSALAMTLLGGNFRQWLFSSRAVETKELMSRGILSDCYEDENSRQALLQELTDRLNAQSPTARMQAKRMVQESMRFTPEQIRMDLAIIRANLSVGDYLHYGEWFNQLAQSDSPKAPSFVDPNNLKKILQSHEETVM